MSIEGVIENTFDDIRRGIISIQRDFALVLKTQGPQVVQSQDVVGMRMGIEHRVDMIDTFPQGLHPKVRAGINDDPVSLPGDGNGRPGTAIARINRSADPAGAAQRRPTHGSSTAKYGV